MRKITLLLLIALTTLSFAAVQEDEKPQFIPPSPQRAGDAARGYTYLTTGDYLSSGVPYRLFIMGTGKNTGNLLNRTGMNRHLSYDYTAVKAPNGETIVAPNCLQCHAQLFDGKLVIGLGNSFSDFTVKRKGKALTLERMLRAFSMGRNRKYEAAKNFIASVKAVSPDLRTTTKGVNLADALAALLVAHRDPATFVWSKDNLLPLPAEIIPSDVPAWWLLKKKNAMFYNGFGRGDFGRFLMAANLLTVTDTSEAVQVDRYFNDVLAYINSLEAPKYPGPIDERLATAGKMIFNKACSSCHGTYGAGGAYPNLLIPESVIGTDSLLYAANYSSPQFVDWFNRSWFTTGDHPARLEPYHGYIAPPLDGIWITAPYFHNGSVPDLEGVLNSARRPAYWRRDFSRQDYNYETPGWHYEARERPGNSEVYNTTARGFGNYGHYFGDALSEAERKAVIEYLKTL